MHRCRTVWILVLASTWPSAGLWARDQSSIQTSQAQHAQAQHAPAQHATTKATSSGLDPGSIANNLYHNKTLGLTFKVPDGWVFRTEELNAREDTEPKAGQPDQKEPAQKDKEGKPTPASSSGSVVLLASFSRPPEAKGEDINSSVLIAAEPQSNYAGLTDAVQYFGPLTEIAKAQGFFLDEDPYEMVLGTKTLARADFHKSVASRVMRQTTLAFLSHGYAVSVTLIAGTDEEIEDLIDALSFVATTK